MSDRDVVINRYPYRDSIILFAIVVIGIVIRAKLVTYNLPICATVDERIALGLLDRLQTVSLNPDYFHKPTFFYYIVLFLLKLFAGAHNMLFYGRAINLVIGGAFAVSVFLLTRHLYKTAIPAHLAAALVMFSPVIVRNSSYIVTDILMMVLIVMAILFFGKFFENYNYKYWFLGIACTGLAISTKYTALILAVAYVIFEFSRIFVRSPSPEVPKTQTNENPINRVLNYQLQPRIIVILLIVLAASLLLAYAFFPKDFLISIIQGSGDLNSTFDEQDLIFLNSLRTKLLHAGIVVALIALAAGRFPWIVKPFCPVRPYIGLGLMGIFFILGSPFVLVSWKTFLYDFGSELKGNELSDEGQQWLAYIYRYFDRESIIIFGFFFVGLWHSFKTGKKIGLLIIYTVLSYAAIGSATRGFERYLTGILPAIFIIASWGLYTLSLSLAKYKREMKYLFLIVIFLISIELVPKISTVLARADRKDEMYRSYVVIQDLKPERVYHAGFSPHLELKFQGFDVEHVPQQWLTEENNRELLQKVQANEVLMVDREIEQQMSQTLRKNLQLLWSLEKGYGQYIYQKAEEK